MLLQCGYNIGEAVQRHRLQAVAPTGFGLFAIEFIPLQSVYMYVLGLLGVMGESHGHNFKSFTVKTSISLPESHISIPVFNLKSFTQLSHADHEHR